MVYLGFANSFDLRGCSLLLLLLELLLLLSKYLEMGWGERLCGLLQHTRGWKKDRGQVRSVKQ